MSWAPPATGSEVPERILPDAFLAMQPAKPGREVSTRSRLIRNSLSLLTLARSCRPATRR